MESLPTVLKPIGDDILLVGQSGCRAPSKQRLLTNKCVTVCQISGSEWIDRSSGIQAFAKEAGLWYWRTSLQIPLDDDQEIGPMTIMAMDARLHPSGVLAVGAWPGGIFFYNFSSLSGMVPATVSPARSIETQGRPNAV